VEIKDILGTHGHPSPATGHASGTPDSVGERIAVVEGGPERSERQRGVALMDGWRDGDEVT
jgi:hypothetical protein